MFALIKILLFFHKVLVIRSTIVTGNLSFKKKNFFAKILIIIIYLFSWAPIIDFVESKYEEYLTAESRVHRKAISDSRVHCCLYFIAPSGHGLKMLDIEFSK